MGMLLGVILAVILPLLGVWYQVGISTHFWINVVLTLFGYIPGICHALWLVLTERQPEGKEI